MQKSYPSIRLVALDLDGTLLSAHNMVTPRTRQAIERAAAAGVVVVPATGRPLSNLPPVVALMPGVRYAITSNGAAVWKLGPDPLGAVYSRYANAGAHETSEPECIVHSPLPVGVARAAFEIFRQMDGELGVFSDGRALKTPEDIEKTAIRFAKRMSTEAKQPNDGRFTPVRDFSEWMSRHAHEVEKMCMFYDSVEKAQAAMERLQALPGVEAVQGSPDNVEITAAGVDKGEALLALARRLGIPPEQTLAVGDSENDRAMLQKAGVAAVMANGMPHIKQLADIVSEADCNHDGVAELFARLRVGEKIDEK